MYTDMYTVTKGHLYSPVEYLQWFYCHFVSFSKGYKIQPVNKLDFRFKATAVSSETIFRNLILRTLNILQPSKVHFCKKKKKMKRLCACLLIFATVMNNTATTTNIPSSLNLRHSFQCWPLLNCLRKWTSMFCFFKMQNIFFFFLK